MHKYQQRFCRKKYTHQTSVVLVEVLVEVTARWILLALRQAQGLSSRGNRSQVAHLIASASAAGTEPALGLCSSGVRDAVNNLSSWQAERRHFNHTCG
ncbi:MAG: hypothetical protein U1F46_11340 [Marinagarivorans sp.]